jgi:hypothetical protein
MSARGQATADKSGPLICDPTAAGWWGGDLAGDRRRNSPASGQISLPGTKFDGDFTKTRGGHKELTKGLGTEEETPVKETGAARRSSGGSFGAAALRVRGREEEWRGVKRRPWCTFYR